MPQQRLYYEFLESKLVPYWYVLTFQPGELNWDKSVYHFDVIAPFEYVERDEYDESLISTGISLSDFIINPNITNRIGINIKSVKRNIERHGFDPYLVRQFIIYPPDIDELLALLPNQRSLNLLIS